jgi:hypothetical protein
MDHEEQFSIEFFYFAKALRGFVRLDNQKNKGSKCSSKERERERGEPLLGSGSSCCLQVKESLMEP